MTKGSKLWVLFATVTAACTSDPTTSFTTPAECDAFMAPIPVSGTIDADTAWLCNTVPYLVEADVFVNGGATLTVGPGVEVQLAGETAIVVGNDAAGGAIIADGTLSPILFTSTQAVPGPGDWEGIVIDVNATAAVFDNVTVSYGGNYTADGSAAGEAGIVVVGTADIQNSTFVDNNRFGIQFLADGHAGTFGANTFAGNTEAGLEITTTHLATIASANTFGEGEVVDLRGGTVETSGTWADLGAPYHMEADTFVQGTTAPAEITVEPGARFQFDEEVAIVVGNAGAGSFVAEGTADAPIVFRSHQAVPGPGDWEGIVIDGNTITASFDHAEFHHGGNYTADGSSPVEGAIGVIAGASAAVTNCTFVENNVRGLYFGADAVADAFGDNTFSGNTFEAMRAEANALGTLMGPNTFGTGEVVGVTGDTVSESATWDDLGAPYRVGGDVFVEGIGTAAVVTIAAGTELQFEGERALIVGNGGPGGIVADASGGAPIVFTGTQAVPGAGDWEGVAIDANATVATFRNVQFSYGGNYTADGSTPGEAALFVIDNDVTVIDSTFTSNSVSGFTLIGDSTALAFSGNTFTDHPVRALSVPASAVATLSGPNTFDITDRIEVRGGTVDRTGTWTAIGAPYWITSDVFVQGASDPVLTLGAGAELQFAGEVAMVVGTLDGGGLVADGTTSPVRFTSDEAVPGAGDWEGLVFDGNTLPGSALTNVELAYCGNYTADGSTPVEACVGVVTSNVSITGSSFSDSGGHGIEVVGAVSPSIAGNTFSNIAYDDVND